MKLYLISQTENSDYDTYDSAVVCAPDEEAARIMDPGSGKPLTEGDWEDVCWQWCRSAAAVTVVYLGEAAESVGVGVVCASFNAG